MTLHFWTEFVAILAAIVAGCGIAYYVLCLAGAISFRRASQRKLPTFAPPVSILKPLKGIDPEIYESFRSHCLQDYADYEIIFGVSDADDPAIASVQRLQQEFPVHRIELVICREKLGENIKASNLEPMLQAARHE